MFLRKPSSAHIPLKPFVIELSDGVLIGHAADPEHASPCKNCVLKWLETRNVEAKHGSLDSLTPLAKRQLRELATLHSPHIFEEISRSGNITRLHCLVFPHHDCHCKKTNYVGLGQTTDQTNFAFSPIYQIKCVRYGTAGGNLWFFSCTGQSPFTQSIVSVTHAHPDKETARLKCVEKWLKKASLKDLKYRLLTGEQFASEDLSRTRSSIFTRSEKYSIHLDEFGVGQTMEEAIKDALGQNNRLQVLQRYSEQLKKPMLIVGSNHWLRERVPFFLLQQYDIHLLFYPNQSPNWVVGMMAVSRLVTSEPPIFSFGSSANITSALESCIYDILGKCRPSDWRHAAFKKQETKKNLSQLNLWWNNWIYSCPKINLKDVLELEPHEDALFRWQSYLQEVKGRIIRINSPHFPSKIRYLIKLQMPSLEVRVPSKNVNGIGTWMTYRNSMEESMGESVGEGL